MDEQREMELNREKHREEAKGEPTEGEAKA